MVVTSTDELFISDRMGFRLRKFDKHGTLLMSAGSKGESPNEFRRGPTRVAYDSFRRKLAVGDYQLPIIKVFDDKMRYEKSYFAPAPVLDLVYDDRGRLIVAVPPAKGGLRSISIFDEHGSVIGSFDPKGLLNEPWMDAFTIDFDRRHKKIIVVFLHRNLIQILHPDGTLDRQFSIDGLPDKVPSTRKVFHGQSMELPDSFMFWDVAADGDGNIYVLGAHFSKKKNRTIYVFQIDGRLQTVLNLPVETGMFSVNENGLLITMEEYGTAVGVYERKRNQ